MRRPSHLRDLRRGFNTLLRSFVFTAAATVTCEPNLSASPPSDRPHPPRPLAQSKAPRVPTSPAAFAPITVHDIRIQESPGKTRLVLELDRQAKVIEHRATHPSRVVLSLPNASMSRSARAKAESGAMPAPFTITHTNSPGISVTLPTAAFRSYKQFTLTNPPRLVVDITPLTDPLSAPPHTPVPLPFPSPPSVQPSAPPAKNYTTIVIDPGHGGKDTGARGQRQTEEKDITLKVGLKLRDLLSTQPGVRVLMTRDQDVFVELEDRAKFANSQGADLFVSVHVNSHPSHQVKGIEIYHFGQAKDQRALAVAARENGTPLNNTGVGWEYLVADLLTAKKIESSLELAWTAKEAMVTHMNGHYAVNDHGVKTAPFYVLRFTSMPSILAEIAYISNPDEERLLRKPAFIEDVAQALFKGITGFLAANKPDPR
jgi:N-acetylmuramoyl-L-alanine amidase